MNEAPAQQYSDDPCIAPDGELSFQREIFREFEAGNTHFFVLHFNVHDYVFTKRLGEREGFQAMRLRQYLGRLLKARGFDVVLHYSLAGGFTFVEDGMRGTLEETVPEASRHARRNYGQRNSQDVIRPAAESQMALSYLRRLLTWEPPETGSDGEQSDKKDLRIGVILEYLETLAPHEDSLQRGPETSFNVQTLHQLTLDRRLRRKHMIIGLTPDLGQIASRLYTGGSECRTYRVDLPVEEVRQSRSAGDTRRRRSAWLEFVLDTLPQPSRDLQMPEVFPGSDGGVEALASQTSGFSNDNLRDLVYYAARTGEPITAEVVSRRKRDVISAESRDLLEIVEPDHDFDTVAGYEYVKHYLTVVKAAINQRASDPAIASIVPKGIMMLGPPGTGKSFMASSLAKETGFNMVKFRNIRSMWVGETERNLNRVLDLISAMHPVIVFVDEVDAALGQRGDTGGGGGGGVERRIFQRILEFMAMDENRGRVLWIAASNRPDLIDAALISRFDLVIPFLLPDFAARRAMLKQCYPAKIGYEFEPQSTEALDRCVEASQGFTGRELDTVCRYALQLSGEERLRAQTQPSDAAIKMAVVTSDHIFSALQDFRRASDPRVQQLQILLAIQATNFRRFLPPKEEMKMQLPNEVWSEKDNDIDAHKLSAYVSRLMNKLQQNRRL